MSLTQVADLVKTQAFKDYVVLETAKKSTFLSSGAAVIDSELSDFLAGMGETYTYRWFAETMPTVRVSGDTTATGTPDKVPGVSQVVYRMSRNFSFAAASILKDLGGDPIATIGGRVANIWAPIIDASVYNALTGVFADNAAAPSGTDTHVQNDMTNDIKGASYVAGTTDFSYAALNFAIAKMGENDDKIAAVIMNPFILARARNLNLVNARPLDAPFNLQGFLVGGPAIYSSNRLAPASGVYETWLLGAGSIRVGFSAPAENADEFVRRPEQANGGGVDELWSRRSLAIAPAGTSYIASATVGGPTDAALVAAGSWSRTAPEREQVPIARLITRES